jgi:hypothetical protein
MISQDPLRQTENTFELLPFRKSDLYPNPIELFAGDF